MVGQPESGAQVLYFLYFYTILYIFKIVLYYVFLHHHFEHSAPKDVNNIFEPCCPMFCKYDHIWNPALLSDVKANKFGTPLPNMM